MVTKSVSNYATDVVSAFHLLKEFQVSDSDLVKNRNILTNLIFSFKIKPQHYIDVASTLCSSSFENVLFDLLENMYRANSKNTLFNQLPEFNRQVMKKPRLFSNLFYFLRFPLEFIWKLVGDFNFRYLFMNCNLFYSSRAESVNIQISGVSFTECLFSKSKSDFKTPQTNCDVKIFNHPTLLCRDSYISKQRTDYPNIWSSEFIITK